MTCIITGCTLRAGNKWVGGDLHLIGNCYIFNAIINGQKEADWVHGGTPHYKREIKWFSGGFERRGVIAFSILEGQLNLEAQEYLAEK